MTNYSLIFAVSLLVNVALTFRSSDMYRRTIEGAVRKDETGEDARASKRHAALLKKYLLVYLLATFSDWLQGPYVYELYSEYGYTDKQIAELFVAGFGSSMIFGSFVGGIADWGGRRTFVLVYAVTYAASCATKHFNNYGILMIGRLLGGIATSLLFSVFEAWLIRAHSDAELPKGYLSKSFSWAQYGNSCIAILSGLVGQQACNLMDMHSAFGMDRFFIGGAVAPFDLSLLSLVACGVAASVTWEENYGDAPGSTNASHSKKSADGPKWYDGLRNALTATLRNRDILFCGIISSLFEGSMYVFVFMWTPMLKSYLQSEQDNDNQRRLEDTPESLPFGVIFATFMVCCMAGSSLFSILVEKIGIETLGVGVFGVASVAMTVISSSNSGTLSFIGMLFFEFCVGLYFPIMGTMKGNIVPEDKRAAIYNLYRIPLNFIVLFSLLKQMKPSHKFILNALMLFTATVMQTVLMKRRRDSTGASYEKVETTDVESASKDTN